MTLVEIIELCTFYKFSSKRQKSDRLYLRKLVIAVIKVSLFGKDILVSSNLPKNQQNSALASKKRLNQKSIKTLYYLKNI